jgi:serine/threonine protein kinase
MDTRQVVARFEAERQSLALMDHPNIAKVFDAGATETGRPYFVMELVRGVRITDYCDQNNLPTGERLDLFLKICPPSPVTASPSPVSHAERTTSWIPRKSRQHISSAVTMLSASGLFDHFLVAPLPNVTCDKAALPANA